MLDREYVRFNKAVEDNAAKTYACFKHLAPVPDKPVLAGGSSSSPEPERAPRRVRARSANRYKVTSSDSDGALPRASALQSIRAMMRRAKVTSDDTDNELGPAAASPRQEVRSTAHNHLASHESDSDVMPMDIDSEPSPAAVGSSPDHA